MLPAVLAMRPVFIEKPWGGTRIARLPAKGRLGHAPPPGVRVGESWEVADLPEGTSTVDGGPCHGRSLRELVGQYGSALVGARAACAAEMHGAAVRFPLLVKLIDADEDLSIQVHPDEAFVREHPGTHPKDEAWLVVDCAPHARVLHGLKDGVSRELLARAIADGTPDTLLREVAAHPGDVFRIRPGTFHAVGGGNLLLEVQQPSNTTFRVWDWGRREPNGSARPLHVREALLAGFFGAQDAPRVGPAPCAADHTAAAGGVKASLSTDHYRLSVHDVLPGHPMPVPRPTGAPAAVFMLDGELDGEIELRGGGGAAEHAVTLTRGATGVVSACATSVTLSAARPATAVVLSTGAEP